VNFTQDKHGFAGEGSSSPCSGEKVNEANANEKIKPPTKPDAATLDANETLEGLKEKLANVTKEKDEARTKLEFLKKNLSMMDYKPRAENAMSWLGYIHKLLDVDDMVNTEINNLLKHAAVVNTSEDNLNGTALNWAAIQRHGEIFNRCLNGLTEFTQWRDIDQMMHRTNHFQNDKYGNVDWAQEIEEG